MIRQDRFHRSLVLAAVGLAAAASTGFGRMISESTWPLVLLFLGFLAGPGAAVAWPSAVFGTPARDVVRFIAPPVSGLCAALIVPTDRLACGAAAALSVGVLSYMAREVRLLGLVSQSSLLLLSTLAARGVLRTLHGFHGVPLAVGILVASLVSSVLILGLFRVWRHPTFLGMAMTVGAILAGAAVRLVHDATQFQIRAMIACVVVEFLLLSMVGARAVAEDLRVASPVTEEGLPVCTVPLLDRDKDFAVEAHVD